MNEHSYPGRHVGHCTCGTWDHLHEPSCGRDVDDSEQIPAVQLLSEPTNHDDLILLTEWMAGPGEFEAGDLAEAVRKPWKYADELAAAREWRDELAVAERKAS